MHNYGHWKYNGIINENSDYGFIYVITNTKSMVKYVGQKAFKSCNRNWKEYTSSSKILNADIKLIGKEHFIFEIIGIADTQETLDEMEKLEQINRDVLNALLLSGIREYYNLNIHTAGFTMSGQKYKCKSRTGTKNTRFDHTVYCFINSNTQKIFSGTQNEFLKHTNIAQPNITHLIRGKLFSANGWVIANNKHIDKRKDNIVYKFMNTIIKELFSGTRSQFRKHTGIKDCYALVNGFNKSCNGWVLLK